MKKSLAVLVCACLILMISPFSLVFTVSAARAGDYTYTVSNGEATITFYRGNNSNVTIPDEIDGYPVTKIGQAAFSQVSTMKNLTISGSVKTIEEYAFQRCYFLENVTLNNGIEKIGSYAFLDCRGLETITIPSSLRELSGTAFKGCNVEKVYITDLLAWCNIDYTGSVGGYCPLSSGSGKLYLNDKLITKLIIPKGVSVLFSDAFRGCDSIKSVFIPSTITNIYGRAFSNCTGITDVWYEGNEKEKNSISIDSDNTYLANATWHYNSCPIGAPHSYDNDCDKSCNVCNKERTVAGHSYNNACDTVCNICNEQRTITHTYDNSCDTECNICNNTRSVTHSYDEWEITKNPSCTESGSKVRKCSICSKIETETVSSLGHKFSSEWTIDKKATCTTAGSKSNHCIRCSETKNNTTIVASGHTWEEWITEKKATEKVEGLASRKCSQCKLKESQSIAKIAADGHTHKFGGWQVIKAATCKEKGNSTRTCSVCKEQEQKDSLATGHQVGEWVEVPATCTSDGVRERTCVFCNETEKITTKALGHDFENPVVIKEPTDTENGIKQGKCKRCGEQTTEEIPALSSREDTSNITSDIETNDKIEVDKKIRNKSNKWFILVTISMAVLVGIGVGVFFLIKRVKSYK